MELSDSEKEQVTFDRGMKDGLDVNQLLSLRKSTELESRDLSRVSKKIDKFLEKYSFIRFFDLEGDDWVFAKFLHDDTNLSASDAIHLATAISMKANLIITNDSHFQKQAELWIKTEKLWDDVRICGSPDVIDCLRKLGFRV